MQMNSSNSVKILLPVAMLLGGCNVLNSKNSPDIIYSDSSAEARSLQIPPDLTDVSNAEQFVLPGNTGGTVTRNTLLPEFDNARFVREGAQSWLEFQQTPEDLWPQLLAFARQEKYRIDKTEPVSGVIVTQWRPNSAVASTGILANLGANVDGLMRIAFRLERADEGSRLFARSQVTSQSAIENSVNATDSDWPASSHNPELTSELLSSLLVFLGVEQQKASGILAPEQAKAITDEAVVQSNASGSQMIHNRGFQISFRSIVGALEGLDYTVLTSDDNAGRIEVELAQKPLVLKLTALHVGAVRVMILDEQGARLPAERERELLASLAEQLT